MIGRELGELDWGNHPSDEGNHLDDVLQSCGHPISAIVCDIDDLGGDIGTCYCRMCVAEAEARDCEAGDYPAAQRAVEAYNDWKQDPSQAIPYEDFRAELVADGLLDEEE